MDKNKLKKPKINTKYNYSGPPASRNQSVGYQSNQKLFHHQQD